MLGCALHAPYPTLEAVNGKVFGALTANTPLSERFPVAPAYRAASLPLADVAADTTGREIWSSRLVEAVASAGPLRAHVLPITLRVRGSRKEVADAGYLIVPTCFAEDWLDEPASDVDFFEGKRRIKSVRRLAVRAGFVAPAPVFLLRGLGLTAVSAAAARAIAPIGLVGTWFEPIEQYSEERKDRYPPSDGRVA